MIYDCDEKSYIEEGKKNETYHVNDLGKKIFLDYSDTEKGRREVELRRKQEERQKILNERRNKLVEIISEDYLESKVFWENNLKTIMDEDEFKDTLEKFVLSWFKKQKLRLPDFEQTEAIANVFDDIQLIARAGSGKTTTIINRALFLVNHCGILPSEILILAFNREAADDINSKLEKLVKKDRPQAMTFHALAYAIVRPEEALIYDDEENGLLKSSSVQQVIDSYLRDKKWQKRIRELMITYFRSDWESILQGGYFLKPDEMVKYRKSLPYVGLDGRYYKSKAEKKIADFLFEHDIPYWYEKNYWWSGINYKPDFTIDSNNSKYKGLVIEFFGLKGCPTYDKQILEKRDYWRKKTDYLYIELYQDERITDEYLLKVLSNDIKNCGFKLNKLTDYEVWLRIKDRATDDFSRLVSQFISRCRKGLISPDNLRRRVLEQRYNCFDMHIEFVDIVSNIYKDYLDILVMNEEEDFDGLLIRADKLVRKGHTVWKRKSGSGDLKNIKFLFIDEYQDFSLLFYNLIDGIRKKNKELKFFCVGDDWQAINRFAGSDLKFFNNFNDYFKNARQLNITSNYRSYEKIVDVSNRVMKGEGVLSKSTYKESGNVCKVYLNDFVPNAFEKRLYKGDIITPALIRIINEFIIKGQKVALLTRRNNSIPFFNNYFSVDKNFKEKLLKELRSAFPKEQRSMIVDLNTSHSYKGKEEDAIIIVDAVSNSYPLFHPNNIFFSILGDTIDIILAEEKRLLYVALSRAKRSLVIVTEEDNVSPFLQNNYFWETGLDVLNVNALEGPKREGTHYIIEVHNGPSSAYETGNFIIKEELKANQYRYDSLKKAWYRPYLVKKFSIDKLLQESWVKKSVEILVLIKDEFDITKYKIDISEGKITVQSKSST